MCVIATGLKKNFESEWFKACCKRNPDGFFVCRVNRNQSIRTLDMNAAIDFFEASSPQDLIVLHARIKSVGPVNSENIHGWGSQGVQFCHNGTLSIKARGSLTDSETFFRDIFLPIYKTTNRRLTKPVLSAINAIIGTSRFLIIRKKAVHRFGTFTEKGNCYFSNMAWVTSPVTTKTGFVRPSKHKTNTSYYEDSYAKWWDDYDYDGYNYDCYDTLLSSKPAKKTSTPGTSLLLNLYPLTVTSMIYKVLKKVSSYVSSGLLPEVAQLAIGLDLTNNLDQHMYASDPLKMQVFPYRVYSYMLYFLEEWEGKINSLCALREKFNNPDAVVDSKVWYDFISSESHKKIGATYRTSTYSYYTDMVKAERANMDELETKSSKDALELCAKWTKMSTRIFLMALHHHLTYSGQSSFVRSIVEILDTNDHGCALYVIYQTLREIGKTIRNKSMDTVKAHVNSAINDLYNGSFHTTSMPQNTLLDFWGLLACEIINRPAIATAGSVADLLDARDRVLEAFDLDVTTHTATGPAAYEAVMDYIKHKPGDTE